MQVLGKCFTVAALSAVLAGPLYGQDGMRYECIDPCQDFAWMTDNSGARIASLSMLDGKQVAYLSGDKLMSGKGRFKWASKWSQGLFVSLGLDRKDGGRSNTGFRVDSLTFEFRFDGGGPDARQYVFVHEVAPHANAFEVATKGADGSVKAHDTAFQSLDLCDGRLFITVPGVPEPTAPARTYRTNLWYPFEGKLESVAKPPRGPSCKPVTPGL